jgi:Zn-dependent protease/CBS domain-containing protein
VAQREGLEISSISLFVFGGVSRITGEPSNPKAELKIAAAGPGTSVALAVIFYGLMVWSRALGVDRPVVASLGWLALMNLVLAIFNLVPGLPLDGGRLLRATIWHFTGNQQSATRIAAGVGQGFGYLLMFLGLLSLFGRNFLGGVWWLFIGWFLVQAATSSYQQLLLRRALAGIPVSRLMTREVIAVPANMSLAQLVDDYFLTKAYSAYPVVSEAGEVQGLVTVADVRTVPREEWARTPVQQVVEPLSEEFTVKPETDGWDALVRMAESNRGRLLVTEDHQLVGIVSQTNIMHLLRTRMDLNLSQ